MMANEDYEDVLFSDYDDFISKYEDEDEDGEPDIGPGFEWSSDPLLKVKLSHPSKIPRPSRTPIPTPPPTIDSNLQPQPQIIELDPFHVPKWFSETEISEEERYECSVYGEMLLDRYNQVKGTDFEFVRLVKMKLFLAAGVSFKIQFEAKPRAAAEYTLKTFEAFVFKDAVYKKVWPQSCRLVSPNRDSVYDEEYCRPNDEEYRRPMCTYEW
ncbi:uncharacterized protein LOC115953663 [Quercus lobata]|uniref:Cystatin domain-containing protein n=1 Tax=Quercus lobata TaxID=97700 RepID=A0A7N2M5X9_QUELO|nr:uncharacterized protein LOC115953663 [Quercus lobata]XP_030927275.1 uncharacterized protein LOC115953663 [Quercus lobata]